jgi:hypothetical protein
MGLVRILMYLFECAEYIAIATVTGVTLLVLACILICDEGYTGTRRRK